MPRRSDPDAPHSKYSAQSYIEMLRKCLLPYARSQQLLMHENSSIHTARVVERFLANVKPNTKEIDWRAYTQCVAFVSRFINKTSFLFFYLSMFLFYIHRFCLMLSFITKKTILCIVCTSLHQKTYFLQVIETGDILY
jgi:hypothetical protein